MAPSSQPRFRTITSFTTDYSPSKITKYESTKTGMTAVVVDRQAPKVFGYFALATEIFDDSGAPHTLEHLIFMGSKNYRYKGILDRMATRAYSDTNAWTATDHTAYTLETAGWEGFLQILPVYLEHVMAPTLTDAGCYTEVHHIDGAGQDAGVVYSEMQGIQNTQSSLMMQAGNKLIYPDGIGFRYETGGMMDALRVLTANRIREFHKEMYQPKNLCLVIVGDVNHEELLKSLEEFEDSMKEEFPIVDDPWRRPWVDSKPIPPIEKNIVRTVEFPEKDESTGEVMIGMLGPDCNDIFSSTALEIMRTYLTGSSVSVLESKLVEIEEPWASSVHVFYEDRPNSLIWIDIYSVKTKKLEAAAEKVFEVLKETCEKPLDMKYLQQIIRRERRQLKYYTEGNGKLFSNFIIADHLFGPRDASNLKLGLESLQVYDELANLSDADWRNFLRRWYADNTHVTILGRPSAKLAKQNEADEKARIQKRVKLLGGAGLKKLQKKLDAAKAENEREIPKEIFKKFPVPGVESIKFIKTGTARGGLAKGLPSAVEITIDERAQKLIDNDDDPNMPLYLHFEDVPSNFVHIHIFISVASIPVELRPLLSIFLDNFFNTPIMVDGVKMEYQEVVARLEDDTVEFEMSTADSVGMSEGLCIKFTVEPEKYETAIKWIKTMMLDSIFDASRLSSSITKQRSDIPDYKRDGRGMSVSISHMVQLSRDSIGRARDTLVKVKYLKRIDHLLKESPEEAIKQFEKVREALFQLDNFRVLVIADVENLKNPVTAWKTLVSSTQFNGPDLAPIDRRVKKLTESGAKPGGTAYIVPIPSIDSSFARHSTLGPCLYTDPQLPALMFVLSYLGAVEGPLWTAARGNGLAYGVSISRTMQSGHVDLHIYRSPDAYKAFAAVKKVCAGYQDGSTPFDSNALEGALSSLVVEFADSEPDHKRAGIMSFVHQVTHGVSKNYNSELLKKVKDVTIDDMKKVLKDIIMPLFDPATSNVFVTTSVIKAESITKQFKADGFNAEVKNVEDFEDDYGVKYGLNDGQEEEDDDVDDGNDDDDDDDDDDHDEDDSEQD